MGKGVFCITRETTGSSRRRFPETSQSRKVVLLSLMVGLLFLLCFNGRADASIVRYDVVSGADNLGNPVSGSIYVESTLSPSLWLGYDIVEYNFHSSALDYAGVDGDIYFRQGPDVPTPGSTEVVAGNTSMHLGKWGNALAGVWFYDQAFRDLDETIANYSILHKYIRVADLNWRAPQGDEAYGLGAFVFQAASVAAPSALLLLAPGLAGLAFLRRRLLTGRDGEGLFS